MQLILGDHGLHGRDLGHLMPLGLRIRPLQWLLAASTALGLDGEDHVHLFAGHQAPRVSLVPGLPPRPTPAGLAPWPLGQRLWRVARRRARRGARGLLQLLPQLLDHRLQRRHPGFEGADVGLRLRRYALPEVW